MFSHLLVVFYEHVRIPEPVSALGDSKDPDFSVPLLVNVLPPLSETPLSTDSSCPRKSSLSVLSAFHRLPYPWTWRERRSDGLEEGHGKKYIVLKMEVSEKTQFYRFTDVPKIMSDLNDVSEKNYTLGKV